MTTAALVMDDMVAALEAQGIQVEQYYPSSATGSRSCPSVTRPALAAADRQVFYRETVRAVAYRHGLYASLAPKPFPDQAGNGSHVHWSLWDRAGRRNLTHDPEGRFGVSRLGYHFIAGVLEHLPALLALTCPSVELVPPPPAAFLELGLHGVGTGQSRGSRPHPLHLRLRSRGSTNAELKACDASANPYLALGGLLAAGLDGVARKLEPGEPIMVDPADYTEAERAASRHRALPGHPRPGPRSSGGRPRSHECPRATPRALVPRL
jgi:glutamine synthetase